MCSFRSEGGGEANAMENVNLDEDIPRHPSVKDAGKLILH
jgi:hypothetical protein